MSKPLTPQLRFKGYTDNWKSDSIGNVTRSYSGGTPTVGCVDFYGGSIPFIRSGEIHGNTTELYLTDEGLAKSSAAIVSKGTILYALYGATSGEVAISQINGAINQAILAIITNDEYDSYCLSYWLYQNKLPIINTYLQGGQGNLSGTIVKSIEFMLPRISEQQEIGEYFKQVDELIAEAEREVERLEKMKLASLQKMFPRPGTTTPEIRFTGFTGNWKKAAFSDLFSPIKNNTLSRACLNYDYGKIKNIHYGDILIKFGSIIDVNDGLVPYINDEIGLELNNFNTLSNGDIIFADTAEDDAVGKCVEIDGAERINVVSGLHTIAVRPNKEFANGFLGYYLNSNVYHYQLLPLMQGIKVLSISKSAIADTIILYPESLAEQKNIGEYFRNLDELISAKRQKLAKLRNIKKSCLNKMFVNTSEL